MKIYLDTIGCRLNQAEIEIMARQFRGAGHEIVASPEQAELAVVNTCAVTNDAAAVSRGRIRQIGRAGVKEIVATGCWSTLQPAQASSLPNVLRVVPNDHKDDLVADLLNLPTSTFDLEPIQRQPLPGLHRRTRAFIKVQDGCENHCTFCITTVARGESHSRSVADVILDIQSALAGGTKEVVLTGVHLGSWGQDLSPSASTGSARRLTAGFGSHLKDLIRAILRETDTPRLRLSSLEPWDLDEDFFSLWDASSSAGRLMPHLHLPLQSGCESTLRRMARKTTPASFRKLVSAARDAIPDIAITTDIIAGFPGESEDEFAESLAFVKEMDFAGGHVFTYSARPGTGAAKMKAQVRPELRKKRNHILRAALDESESIYRQRFVGRTLSVLWESASEIGEWGWQMEGWTGNYLRVKAFTPSPCWNELDTVVLTQATDNGIMGEMVK